MSEPIKSPLSHKLIGEGQAVSYIRWPKGSLGGYENDTSSDLHPSKAHAVSVLFQIKQKGMGLDGEVFPKSLWVEWVEDGTYYAKELFTG